ncbi:MAG: hypothetical protein OEU46_02045 [Alphaproteobacteria bacterium]|nr:hypothetical protein [Alphaproteobacteria bacterium]
MISIARILVAGLVLAGLATPALAGKYDLKGTLTGRSVNIPGCGVIDSMSVKYSVGTFMGGTTLAGVYKWTAGKKSVERCINYSTDIYLKVHGQNGRSGYIKVSPSTSKSGKGYGFDTTGSPDWNAFICNFRGGNCLTANDAKNLIKSGYSITSFRVHTRDIPKAKSRSRGSSTSTRSKTTYKPRPTLKAQAVRQRAPAHLSADKR